MLSVKLKTQAQLDAFFPLAFPWGKQSRTFHSFFSSTQEKEVSFLPAFIQFFATQISVSPYMTFRDALIIVPW